MPYGNKSQTLQTRLQKTTNQFEHREPHEIVGTNSWTRIKNQTQYINGYNAAKSQERFFDGMSHEEKLDFTKNKIPHKFLGDQFAKNTKLIDNINFWVDENGWHYIEGGEYNGMWVNPTYPNKLFRGDRRTMQISPSTSETIEFPCSSFEEDPKGIALHVSVNNSGTGLEILPNKWTNMDDTRRGRKIVRQNKMRERRHSRWEQYNEAENIKDPIERREVIAGLKMKFQSEDIKREQKAMGYTDEEMAMAMANVDN